jgi:hypothetical protein
MRQKKSNETARMSRGSVIEYFDEQGRNTYYYNKFIGIAYEKEWITLPNGEDREAYVEGKGYWRRHWYDAETGELLRELDSQGQRHLLDKRQIFNPNDKAISKEIRESNYKIKLQKSQELF